ncbi:hypothetical protein CEP54_007548 [Fusarium duplospermum]|uniref:Uncharacterized protein n=1 Tax=Fusarium duplospermum TaxID=1325734 RepID=A0A428Q0V0_9HYPO|nr:hypothetical protein CEP54_007548 [Fusarium duplospermum]
MSTELPSEQDISTSLMMMYYELLNPSFIGSWMTHFKACCQLVMFSIVETDDVSDKDEETERTLPLLDTLLDAVTKCERLYAQESQMDSWHCFPFHFSQRESAEDELWLSGGDFCSTTLPAAFQAVRIMIYHLIIQRMPNTDLIAESITRSASLLAFADALFTRNLHVRLNTGSCVHSKCDLRIEFHPLSSTHPDPLTRIALDDIRASGMKQFFESQSAPTYVFGASTTVEMERWLESKITQTRSYFEQTSRPSEKHEAPDPWVFRRVVVCNSQWPGDANWSNIEEAEQSVSNTVDTLNQCLTRIDTHFKDHPSDPMTGDLDLATWAARQYSNRQPSPNSTFALRQRFEVGGTFHKQFNSSVVCLRCFLWLYADILSVEANILRACSGTLHMDPPQVLVLKVEEPSMFQKVVRFLSTTTILAPLPIILGQVVRAFTGPEPPLIAPEPPLIAPAICELII